ncbi:MAG: CDP-diacylglycerol--glycerol-3-phosphate 3-phosphatidyltransferase [Tissierellia bacterium]|nr:CDP-diacylglycerol--glycerol-3-phosphate 3-phosphatidyltransferase [Tissierellia bacterium]
MNVPNSITFFRICLVPVFVLSVYLTQDAYSYIPLLIFIFASITDSIDGYIARKYDLITKLGKFLDPLADKILVMSAFVLLVEMGKAPAWAIILIEARELAVTGFRIIAASGDITIAASSLGKIKTISQMLAITLAFLPEISIITTIYPIIFYFAVFMTVVSGVDYFYKNKHVFSYNE